jgi:hypothetical protein
MKGVTMNAIKDVMKNGSRKVKHTTNGLSTKTIMTDEIVKKFRTYSELYYNLYNNQTIGFDLLANDKVSFEYDGIFGVKTRNNLVREISFNLPKGEIY